MKKGKQSRSFLVLFSQYLLSGLIIVLTILFMLKIHKILAADDPLCGTTIVANLTLDHNIICSGHGLVVGANGITIDGGGYTITGDGDSSDYGINDSDGYDNITIQNFGNITDFGDGVYFSGVTGSTIQNIIANSNTVHGINLESGSESDSLDNNTVNTNGDCGISLVVSNSNELDHNTANSNLNYGIYIYGSNSNTLTGNRLSTNTVNLFVAYGGFSINDYNNTIDTTNKVEGKSVYYLYNNDGTAENPHVYDGDVLGNDIGMFWSISCDYIHVKNVNLSTRDYYGIFFKNTTHSTIERVTIISNHTYGIYLISSSTNTLSHNLTNSNSEAGVYLAGSSSNEIEDNIANSNNYYGLSFGSSSSNNIHGNAANLNGQSGIYITGSSLNQLNGNTLYSNGAQGGIYLTSSNSNTLAGNSFTNNRKDYYDDGINTYFSNLFNHNLVSKMFTFVDTEVRTKNINEAINFSITAKKTDGTACANCTSITVSPAEASLTHSDNGNGVVTGSFIPTKPGTYSLIVTISDSGSNITKRNILFFVGTAASQTTKYYFRGISPNHGQPNGNGSDSKSLLLAAPSSPEIWDCITWIGNSPDIVPTYPLASLLSINSFSWYKKMSILEEYAGVQRYLTYDTAVDLSNSVSDATKYTWVNKNFTNINWGMDYQWSWYWLALKMGGSGFVYPYQTTFPAAEADADPASWAEHHHLDGTTDASYADFTYSYTTTPAIKAISNDDIVVLSATATSAANTDPSIVLNNPTSASASTTLTLDSITRPFINGTTVINSDGSATVSATLASSATTTLDTANLVFTPSTGTVTVNIDTWNISGTYYKKWTEEGSIHDIITQHTLSDLKPNTEYVVKINGSIFHNYLSNSAGQITFTYEGGYSTKTFEVVEYSASSATALTALPVVGSNINLLEYFPILKHPN